jgi:hypothetical protein
VLLSLAGARPARAWGRYGHYVVARLAVSNLPADVPAFFTRAVEQLQFLSAEPDEWRDDAEQKRGMSLLLGHDPDHIFKFELYSPAVLPPDRYSYLNELQNRGRSPASVGMLPYRAVELVQRIRVSWRRWQQAADPKVRDFHQARIIDDSGILGHYIADAAQPLHMSVNRNGWELPENPRGYTLDRTLHRRFETEFTEAHVTDRDVQRLIRPVRIVDELLPEIYAHMRRSFAQLKPLYELEAIEPFTAKNSRADARTFVSERLGDAASTLRDLWYTAYVTSR